MTSLEAGRKRTLAELEATSEEANRNPDDYLTITPLGAGNEVSRCCHGDELLLQLILQINFICHLSQAPSLSTDLFCLAGYYLLQVGRSCLYIEFKGKRIMLDCGIHPAYNGIGGLPYFDEIDPSTIDLLLISHFHLDHCAALPYFLEKTNFKGKVFMTHPTKAIYKMLLSDYVKVNSG